MRQLGLMKKVALDGSVLLGVAALVSPGRFPTVMGRLEVNDGHCGSDQLPPSVEPAPHLREQQCLVDAFFAGARGELRAV